MPDEAPEKKILVDEDWKEQAQREKEMLAEAFERGKKGKHRPLPEQASFALLVTSLATEAIIGLGEMENPITHKREANLDHAKFHIDMLEMLEQKTKGNLTPEEARMLQGVLFDLRMRFVEKTTKPAEPTSPFPNASFHRTG